MSSPAAVLRDRIAALEKQSDGCVGGPSLHDRLLRVDATLTQRFESKASRDVHRLLAQVRLQPSYADSHGSLSALLGSDGRGDDVADPLPLATKAALLAEARPRIEAVQVQCAKASELADDVLDGCPWAVSAADESRLERVVQVELPQLVDEAADLHASVLALLKRYVEAVDAYSAACVQWAEEAEKRVVTPPRAPQV